MASTGPLSPRGRGGGVRGPINDTTLTGLELNPRLCLHPVAEGVLDHLHLGHQIGDGDDFILRVAAGDTDMEIRDASFFRNSTTSSTGR
jgi:hypothetical protein